MKLVNMGMSLNWTDHKLRTPLHYAAKYSEPEMASLLIKLGADPNALDSKGRSPAVLAEDKNKVFCVKTITSMGGKKIRMAAGKEEFKKIISVRRE
jgi:ankyrin repeat protein